MVGPIAGAKVDGQREDRQTNRLLRLRQLGQHHA